MKKEILTDANERLAGHRFESGQLVPRSGTYRAIHRHPVAREVLLLKNHIFPNCVQCSVPIQFATVNWVPRESASARYRLLMHKRQPLVTPIPSISARNETCR
jgi:hypothetical protein